MPATIRWDRLSRYGLLAVLAMVLLLYVNPLRSYVSTWQESHRRAADVSTLEREHQQLQAKQRALKSPGVVESEARRLGLVKQGERGFVVTGLPKGK
ncbi:MAG TPA: septum formation initiator family protein [Solirubrobacteraceae bacterium]|nr:septum formation initiator family protein [Solirubrobacteraceae bacterium]